MKLRPPLSLSQGSGSSCPTARDGGTSPCPRAASCGVPCWDAEWLGDDARARARRGADAAPLADAQARLDAHDAAARAEREARDAHDAALRDGGGGGGGGGGGALGGVGRFFSVSARLPRATVLLIDGDASLSPPRARSMNARALANALPAEGDEVARGAWPPTPGGPRSAAMAIATRGGLMFTKKRAPRRRERVPHVGTLGCTAAATEGVE